MSNAILIIDMPKNCNECSLLCQQSYKRSCEDINFIGKTRPEECPLRELPQKAYNGTTFEISNAYTRGWNACIDEILKRRDEKYD